jgi:hypothetical protein
VKRLVSSGHEVEHHQHVRGQLTQLLPELLLLNRLMVSPAALILSGASSVLGDVVRGPKSF